ncbi:MAG: DUF2125 domain-containing protein [Beijerinckiaceae bacterium]|nr:DUF2125 domain-containing protein [Beijerinckiaceae bacterium]
MTSKAPVTKRRLRNNSWLVLPFAMLVMAPLGWSLFWYVKSRQAAAALTEWMANEAQKGSAWSCPRQNIGGFPNTVAISCNDMTFHGEALGKTWTGTLRGLLATAALLRNDNVLVTLNPPFTAKSTDGSFDVTVQWGEMLVELDGGQGMLGKLAFIGSQVKLQGKAGTVPAEATFGDISGYFAMSPGRKDQAYDVMLSFHQGSIPELNELLNTQQPVALQFEGTLSQAAFGSAASLPESLEHWRAANGRLDINFASLSSGDVAFNAKGGLSIDSGHRLQGKLDANFAGLDKPLRQLKIDPSLLTAGQALSELLGASHDPARWKLPVTLSDGYVWIGPVPTTIEIPPLY